MMRQTDRTRRLIALLPAMFAQPKRVPQRVFRTVHIGLLYGVVGVKAHFRRLERALEGHQVGPPGQSRSHRPATRLHHLAPSYVGNSAGIGCLYRLCHNLRERGIEAYVTAQ